MILLDNWNVIYFNVENIQGHWDMKQRAGRALQGTRNGSNKPKKDKSKLIN